MTVDEPSWYICTASANTSNATLLLRTYTTPITLTVLYLTGFLENVFTCIFLLKKSRTDKLFIMIAGLAMSNAMLAIDGCLFMVIFMYMCYFSAASVPSVVCGVVYTCWLLATQVSTTLIMVVSIYRVLSVRNILRGSPRHAFTRQRVIRLVVAVGIVSVLVNVSVTTLDYTTTDKAPPFCHFRRSISVLHITTHVYLIAYIINYVVCVSLYVVSICILVRVHLLRAYVYPSNEQTSVNCGTSQLAESTINSITETSVKLSVSKLENGHAQSRYQKNRKDGETFQQEMEETTEGLESSSSISNSGGKTLAQVYRTLVHRKSREFTATLIVGIIIVLHSACLIPWIIHLFLLARDTDSVKQAYLAMMFGALNVLVDPLIYVISLKEVRKKIIAYVKCKTNI